MDAQVDLSDNERQSPERSSDITFLENVPDEIRKRSRQQATAGACLPCMWQDPLHRPILGRGPKQQQSAGTHLHCLPHKARTLRLWQEVQRQRGFLLALLRV